MRGMVSLKETLIGAGLDVSGWNLYSAQAISADGFTIVGSGTNPSGRTDCTFAHLRKTRRINAMRGKE